MGVGRWLRHAREKRGLSMAEVAARTKIPLRQLAALEAEEYGTLPGGIFVRGHIRATAKAVGLDPTEVTEHFEEETKPPAVVAVPPESPEGDRGPRLRMAAESRQSKPNRHMVAALLILLSIVLAIAWFGRERDAAPSSQNEAASQGRVAALDVPGSAADPAQEPRAVVTTGQLNGDRPDGVMVLLEAQRVCRVSLTVDGQRVSYRMQPGERVTAQMHQRAAVRTGDAGALMLSIAGGPPQPLGAAGAIANIEFTPDDYSRLISR